MFTMDDVNRQKQERIEKSQSGKAVEAMSDEEKRRTKIIAELALRRMELAKERIETGQELEDPNSRPVTRAELTDDELFSQIEAQQKAERIKKLQEKKNNKFLLKSMMTSGGNSKAMPGQYTFREDPADNPTRRAIVHHTGSHYHSAHSKSFKVRFLSTRICVCVLRIRSCLTIPYFSSTFLFLYLSIYIHSLCCIIEYLMLNPNFSTQKLDGEQGTRHCCSSLPSGLAAH